MKEKKKKKETEILVALKRVNRLKGYKLIVSAFGRRRSRIKRKEADIKMFDLINV